jgi:tetrahydromethanopterin S-methyltransferase subunit B
MLSLYNIFVGIFFFTYGVFIEKRAVKKQVKYIVDNLVPDIVSSLDPTIRQTILKSFPSSKQIQEDLSRDDERTLQQNEKIRRDGVRMIAGFACIGMGIVIVLNSTALGCDISILEVVKRNILILAIVAIVEVVFFTLVPTSVQTIDSNFVKKSFLLKLQQKLRA